MPGVRVAAVLAAIAAVVVGAVAAAGLAAVAAESEPVPGDDLSRFESARAGLSVLVEHGTEPVRAERDTTYTITVRSSGEEPEPVTIRVSVPPTMSEVAPDDGGVVAGGYVEWPVTVGPSAPATLHLTGAYTPASGERAGGPARVTLTACALGEEDGQPIVCATDSAELQTRSRSIRWWLLAAAAAAAAVVVIVAGGLAFVRRRRRAVPAAA